MNFVENARGRMNFVEKARGSKFTFVTPEYGKEYLRVENAVIMYRNFEGRPTKNNTMGGSRSFVLVLPEDVAYTLRERGWYITESIPNNPDEEIMYKTEIAISYPSEYKHLWPDAKLYTEFDGKKASIVLDQNSVKKLDELQLDVVDLGINEKSKKNPSKQYGSIKGYLRFVRAHQAPLSDFDKKWAEYDDVPEEEYPSEDDEEAPF